MADVTRAGVELVQRNLETAQQAWQANNQLASQLIERSTGQFARTAGMSGEDIGNAARQTSEGFQGIAASATVLVGSMQNISREWFDLCQKMTQKSADNLERLAQCRTAPEMLAAKTDILRDHVEGFVQSARRMSEVFVQTADRAERKSD
jgi:hypothetical protein